MKLLYFIIIIMLTNFFPSTHIYAVDKIEQSIPKISVNILIVPEIEACRPDGYTNYSSENYFCEPLTAKDIERWEQTGQITEKYTIPPSVISLGPRLSETLYAYSLLPLTGPKTRLCAIFVFKWNSPQNGMVSLNRYSTQGNIPNGEYTKKELTHFSLHMVVIGNFKSTGKHGFLIPHDDFNTDRLFT